MSPTNRGAIDRPAFGDRSSRFGWTHDGKNPRGIERERWSTLIGEGSEDFLPLRIHAEGERQFLYFQKYDAKEKQLVKDLGKLLDFPSEAVDIDRVQNELRETLEERTVRRNETPVHLNLQQRIGICLSILQRLTIISGGPGTGKTSIVVALLRALVRMGVAVDRIRLAAPTGRAANRMSESIRTAVHSIAIPTEKDLQLSTLEGMTLHRLLKYRGGSIPFRYHRYNPIPADLIVIDEVSMVDVCLMADLISAVKPGTRLILLGDKDQLPSVEAGAVLGNLIPGLTQTCLSPDGKKKVELLLNEPIATPATQAETKAVDRVVLLDTSYRSEASILDLANRINAGDLDSVQDIEGHKLRSDGSRIDWPDSKSGGFRWIDASGQTPSDWMAVLDSWIDHHFLKSEGGVRPFLGLIGKPIHSGVETESPEGSRLKALFEWLERSRILCLVRRGPYGVEWVNRHVSAKMKEATGHWGRSDLYPGLPILILQNDLSHNLFNGDVGVLLRSTDGTLRGWFQQGSNFLSHPVSSLPHFEPAYAITVHKSQGSEYDRVLFALPDDAEHVLLSREMVYTGLTRAKSLAVLYGTPECLKRAIERRIERDSGRDLWGG
ncbi:MAG: exodeoxyribonuclease V subunit alpha [Candidatus Omnitrophica bacterium]|nr:exodeoxyribonuclease V subunit alpha [Candidatus Omnitrophota bacterium]